MADDTVIYCNRCSGPRMPPGQEKVAATCFVRIVDTGRLCPLCDNCHKVYQNAMESISSATRESLPGHGKSELVSLDDGREAYLHQPSREEYDRGLKAQAAQAETLPADSNEDSAER